MGKMKTYATMFCAMLAMGALTVSCSSEDEAVQGAAEGEGLISFDVKTETGFQSRAVNEDDYENVGNYTVQLLSNSEVFREWNYKDMPDDLKVPVGTYQLKAFYGEDKAASTTSMYVEGVSESVEVVEGQDGVKPLTVTCRPVCAKVVVNFNKEELDKYFSDYYVTFKTAALGTSNFTWAKASTDPAYLKVSANEKVKVTIDATNKADSKPVETVEKEYTLSPQSQLTLNVGPSGAGSIGGITITVDESTNDIDKPIEVPGDWVDDKGEESEATN